MSMNETVFAPAAAPLSGLNALLADFAAWRRRNAAYRETMAELNKLDDRDLADLGMNRADFHYMAKQAAAQV